MTEQTPRPGRAGPAARTDQIANALDGGPGSAEDLGSRVMAMRESGRSYAAIARKLGMERALDAQSTFLRMMRDQPAPQRQATVQRESERLDDLEKRVREDREQDAETAERRLQAVQKMRRALL